MSKHEDSRGILPTMGRGIHPGLAPITLMIGPCASSRLTSCGNGSYDALAALRPPGPHHRVRDTLPKPLPPRRDRKQRSDRPK